jgi:hypothetical protein
MPEQGLVALYVSLVGVVVAAAVAVIVKSVSSRRRLRFDPPPEN